MVEKLPRNKYFSNDRTRSASEKGQAYILFKSWVFITQVVFTLRGVPGHLLFAKRHCLNEKFYKMNE